MPTPLIYAGEVASATAGVNSGGSSFIERLSSGYRVCNDCLFPLNHRITESVVVCWSFNRGLRLEFERVAGGNRATDDALHVTVETDGIVDDALHLLLALLSVLLHGTAFALELVLKAGERLDHPFYPALEHVPDEVGSGHYRATNRPLNNVFQGAFTEGHERCLNFRNRLIRFVDRHQRWRTVGTIDTAWSALSVSRRAPSITGTVVLSEASPCKVMFWTVTCLTDAQSAGTCQDLSV